MLTDLHTIKKFEPNIPCYCFDVGRFKDNIEHVKTLFLPQIRLLFSVKANPFFVEAAVKYADGIEICSDGELSIAAKYNIMPDQITYGGICKERSDLKRALRFGVRRFSIESPRQLVLLNEEAMHCNAQINVLLRLSSGNQFGMTAEEFNWCTDKLKSENIIISGVHFYPGTMRMSPKQVDTDFDMFMTLLNSLNYSGIKEIAYGAGIGVNYFGEYNQWNVVERVAEKLNALSKRYKVTYEAGRMLAADAGIYIARVVDVRQNRNRCFAILNGGRHQFTYHGGISALGRRAPQISVVGNEILREKKRMTIVGALCSESDILLIDNLIDEIREGDYIIFHNAGAYCVTEGMAFFLTRDIPAIFLEQDGTIKLKRNKEINEWIDKLY